MKERTFQCQGCRNFCDLAVTYEEHQILNVKGNGCRRGFISAKKELEKKKSIDKFEIME